MKKHLLTLFCLITACIGYAAGITSPWELSGNNYTSFNAWATALKNANNKGVATQSLNGIDWTATMTLYSGKNTYTASSTGGTNSNIQIGNSSNPVSSVSFRTEAFNGLKITSFSTKVSGAGANSDYTAYLRYNNTELELESFTGTTAKTITRESLSITPTDAFEIVLKNNKATASKNGAVKLYNIKITFEEVAETKTLAISDAATGTNNDEFTINEGDTLIPVKVTPESALKDVVYEINSEISDNTTGLSFSDGVITATTAGTYYVTATLSGATPESVEFKVTVEEIVKQEATITLTGTEFTVKEGETLSDVFTVEPTEAMSDIVVTIAGTDDNGLTYADGVFTAVTAGEYMVEIGIKADSYRYTATPVECTITVEENPFKPLTFTPEADTNGVIQRMAGEAFQVNSATAGATWTYHLASAVDNEIPYTLGDDIVLPYRSAQYVLTFTATIGDGETAQTFTYPDFNVKYSRFTDYTAAFEQSAVVRQLKDAAEGTTFTNPLNFTNLQEGHTPGVTYSINENPIATINTETGELTFTGIEGEAEITAIVGGDKNNDLWYGQQTIKYTISATNNTEATFNFTTDKAHGLTAVGSSGSYIADNTTITSAPDGIVEMKFNRINTSTEPSFRFREDKGSYYLRAFKNGKVTLTVPEGYCFTKIVFDARTSYSYISCNNTTLSNNTWTADKSTKTSKIDLTFSNSSNINAITIELYKYSTADWNVPENEYAVDHARKEVAEGGTQDYFYKYVIAGQNGLIQDAICNSSLDGTEAFAQVFSAKVEPAFTPVGIDDLNEEHKPLADSHAKHLYYEEPVVHFNSSTDLSVDIKVAGKYTVTLTCNGTNDFLASEKVFTLTVNPSFDFIWCEGPAIADEGNDSYSLCFPEGTNIANLKDEDYFIKHIDPGHITYGGGEGQENGLWYKITYNTNVDQNGDDTEASNATPIQYAPAAEAGWKLMDGPINMKNAASLALHLETNGATAEKTFNMTGGVTTGVNDLLTDTEEGEVMWFDFNGMRVKEPAHGLYIRVQNGKATKTIIR